MGKTTIGALALVSALGCTAATPPPEWAAWCEGVREGEYPGCGDGFIACSPHATYATGIAVVSRACQPALAISGAIVGATCENGLATCSNGGAPSCIETHAPDAETCARWVDECAALGAEVCVVRDGTDDVIRWER